MKIRTYLFFWFLAVLIFSVSISIWFEAKAFHFQKESLISNEIKKFDTSIKTSISEIIQNFSGSLPIYVYKSSLIDEDDKKIEELLSEMREHYGADWAFITIDGKNYIYPYTKAASSMVYTSRPWYVSSLGALNKVVENEFYSNILDYPIITMSVALRNGNAVVVGGVIFKENRFFSMISTQMGGKAFLVLKDKKVIYPPQWQSNLPLHQNEVIKFNGMSYLLYYKNYDVLVKEAGINSQTGYEITFLIPYSTISRHLTFSWLALTLVFLTVIGAIMIAFWLSTNRISKAITSLSSIATSLDLKNMILEINPKLEKEVKSFKETYQIYTRFVEMFQDITAHIEELKATNQELESSYEDIENLSNNLAIESSQLKELSESSKLIAMAHDVNEAANILLSKMMNIYGCDGAALLDVSGEDVKVVRMQGEKFEVPLLNPIREKLMSGVSTTMSRNGKNYYIAPILFGSNPIAVIIMMFKGTIPTGEDMEYINNFSTHFAAVLNSNRMIKELRNSYIYLAEKFSEISEIYDYETGSHVQRVGKYSELIAKKMGMSDTFVEQIGIYAMIHDIGKLKVPREILMKNGPLTSEEFEEMKKHTIYGEKILGDAPFLEMARHIARSHHEKYDGSGYPDGLKGNEIPVEARIVAIADVYDALRSPRRYKKAYTHEEAFKIITEGDGRTLPQHFDPDILRIFKENHLEFSTIYRTLGE